MVAATMIAATMEEEHNKLYNKEVVHTGGAA
jgi:hypothetical protein